jgi:methyl-accepting chemotaxis protein
MAQISASSRRITEIVDMIEGIALQTHILALNASVEAARAGEHGRGFGVVAEEVQMLAQRSSDAAKQIRALISVSAAEVDAGSLLVQDAGVTMTEIVAKVSEVDRLIQSISHASQRQTERIALLKSTLGQIDSNTQHNAVLVEQTSAAAESLRRQAERLSASVSAFRLGLHETATPAPAPEAAPYGA